MFVEAFRDVQRTWTDTVRPVMADEDERLVAAYCPICASNEFRDHAGRPGALCVGCGALERHRMLVHNHGRLLEAGGGRTALEVGPLNEQVYGEFLRDRGWIYVSVDRSRRGNEHDPRSVAFVDMEADLRDLSRFGSATVSLVIVQHVIEEIPEYGLALSELARVLTSDGVALLEIPFDPRRERSERQEPDRYGNVWRFGADLIDSVGEHFGAVDVVASEEGAYLGRILVCRRGPER